MATTAPLRSREQVAQVRAVLSTTRDRALFDLAINTALRGGDLVALNIGDVRGLKEGDDLVVREQKTTKRRRVTLNAAAVASVQALLAERPAAPDDSPLFCAAKLGTRLTPCSYSRLVKSWARAAGLEGNFAGHTCRKTPGYLARVEGRASIEVLQKFYGHSSPATTLVYCAIQDHETKAIYTESL